MYGLGSTSPPGRSDCSIWASDELATIQAKPVKPVHSMTPLCTAERTSPPSTSRAHHSPPFFSLTTTLLSPTSSLTNNPRAGETPMMHVQPGMASDDELTPRETTAMEGDAEMLVDEPTGPEQLTEFGEHTAQARELFRKNCGVEDLQHHSPEMKSASQERDPNKQDPREDMPQLKGKATSRGPIRLQERRPGAQDEGEDLAESKPEATPCRTHAAWVGEAFAACQANKKVRFRMSPIHDRH